MRAVGVDALNEREKTVLRLLAQGYDVKACAIALDVSPNVINERLRSARRKLDATSSREAARMLIERESGANKKSVHKFSGVGGGHQFGGGLWPPGRQAEDAVGEAPSIWEVSPQPYGDLPYVPLRPSGERENRLSRKQRLVAILELAIKLAAVVAIICLIAVLIDGALHAR